MTKIENFDIDRLRHNAHDATSLLKSMANETRLMILCQLIMGEKSVTQLMERVQLSQSALSQHLAILRRERLVIARRDAQSVYYSLSSPEVVSVLNALHEVYCQ